MLCMKLSFSVFEIISLFTSEFIISIAIKPDLASPAKGSVPYLLQSSISQNILSIEYKFD